MVFHRFGLFSLFAFMLASSGLSVPSSDAPTTDQPAGLHLTWQQDPTTTMTIDWHTLPAHQADPDLRYKQIGSDDWKTVTAEQRDFPASDRIIHRVELTGLQPDTKYRFMAGEFTRAYSFRTMPSSLNDRPVRFAAGGDTGRGENLEKMNRVALDYEIEFVVWGGDLPYADGRTDRVDRWHEWFENNLNTLVTEDGRVIPVLTGIGNHETKSPEWGYFWYHYDDFEQTDEWRESIAQYFFNVLAFPGQPGYGVLDFGNYMSIILLDSNHANPVFGAQRRWLEQVMRERARRNVTHIFPVYHLPAYPSHRSFGTRHHSNIRDGWVPLFEKHGVRVALENHDHTYKRTFPILDGEISDDGIVYIGDGAWGVSPREGRNRDEWYINRFESVNHAIIVTLDGETQEYIMVDIDGNEFDSYIDNRHSITGDR